MNNQEFIVWLDGFLSAVESHNKSATPFTKQVIFPLDTWNTLKNRVSNELNNSGKKLLVEKSRLYNVTTTRGVMDFNDDKVI